MNEPPSSPAAMALEVSNGRWWLVPHLDLLNQALVFLSQRKAPVWFIRQLGYEVEGDPDDLLPFTRLIVEMPPRHGKSELVSRYFPAWYLGTHPTHRVILTSYEANFARSWGRKARDLLKEHGVRLFGVSVAKDSEAANDWEIEGSEGGMATAGVGGPITGRGANLFISDDAVKNAEEAASLTIQQRNADWWDSTAYTRLEPDGVAVVMATRWHVADLTGHILAVQDEDGDKDGDLENERWYVLKLPALAEDNDVLGRAEGEALWPQRYPVTRLRRIRERIGSYFFGALYQQHPAPAEGGLFDRRWWKSYRREDIAWRWQNGELRGGSFVDTAQTVNEGSDYSVIATWLTDGVNAYLWDVRRGRWTFPELVRQCVDVRERHHVPIYIEQVPWSLALIETLKTGLDGINSTATVSGVVPWKLGEYTEKSKRARAEAASPFCEAGNLHLPYEAVWKGEFIEEHALFPKGAHDDQVDTTSMFCLKMLAKAGVSFGSYG